MHPEKILEKSQSNFNIAFSGLEKKQKRALTAIYAFCRVIDDIADEEKNPQIAQSHLSNWRVKIDDLAKYQDVLSKELYWCVEQFNVNLSNFHWLIDGVKKDLSIKNYQTWDDLFSYCDAVASSVGYMCMEVFGQSTEKPSEYVLSTGRALQLTNIIRDVFEDISMGRIYLPEEHWKRFDVKQTDFFEKKWSPSFEKMIQSCLDLNATLYETSNIKKQILDAKKIWPAEIMKDVYFQIYKKIQKNPVSILSGKVSISKVSKFWISKKQYMRAML